MSSVNKKERCVLYDRECTNCGECEFCDLDPLKICDNCGKCLNVKDFASIKIDGIKGVEKNFTTKQDDQQLNEILKSMYNEVVNKNHTHDHCDCDDDCDCNDHFDDDCDCDDEHCDCHTNHQLH